MEATASLPLYQFEPLQSFNHVRVLALQPAQDHKADLQASIIQYDRTTMYMGSDPVYEAISYTWGDPSSSNTISIDETAQLPITSNVDIMLRYFRKTDVTRYLWVDAICLNQEDHVERTIQVRRMGAIYGVASKVRIWLGEAGQEARLVLGFFLEIVRLEDVSLCNEFAKANARLTFEAINDFLSRPWFSRRWILQEAVLNIFTTVHAGKHSIHWDQLMEAISLLRDLCTNRVGEDNIPTLFTDIWKNPRSRETMSVMSRLRSPQNDIFSLLWDFHTSECRDPADRIRAIYGLANLDSLQLENLDREAKAPWPVLYQRLAKLATIPGSWTLLQHVFAFGSLSKEVPFVSPFTPNWASARHSASYLQILSSRLRPCNPNQDVLLRKSRYATECLLGQGLEIMAIQRMRPTSRSTDAWKPFLKVIGYRSGYIADSRCAIARSAGRVIANLLPLASEGSIATSDDTQTLLSVSLEGLPDGDMEINYQEFGEWLADRAVEPRGKSPSSAWIQHCVHVLYNLFQEHSFFVCKNIHQHHDYVYGFGPRDLVPNDIVVDSDASSWKQGGNSMGFAISPLTNNLLANSRTYRLMGSCWILGQKTYDTEPREFSLAMPGEVQTFLDHNGEASTTFGLKERALGLKDRLVKRLSPNPP